MKKAQSFLYLEIAESIRRLIAAGELQSGDKLSPVRQMAQQWHCTPGTVARAYELLGEEGLVVGHRGGGTRVTSSALAPDRPILQWASLVNDAERFLLSAVSSGHSSAQVQTALSVAVSRWRDLQGQSTPAAKSTDAKTTLRFIGSHDLLMEALANMLLEQDDGVQLSAEYTGSLGGLMALAQQRADLAGTHLWDETTDSYNAPFVRRLLPGRRVMLLTLAFRSLGLIAPIDNPWEIQSLQDLTQEGIVLVNRQRGSGTRVWLDAQLEALNIQAKDIIGYDREELTHLAVARIIADGQANVGLGIHAAAAAYGLHFVPLTQERYELAIPQEVWNSSAVHTLTHLIQSDRFKETVAALGGYNISETGRERWVS